MTDFDDAVCAVDAHVCGHADGPSALVDDGEKQGVVACRRFFEPALKAVTIIERAVGQVRPSAVVMRRRAEAFVQVVAVRQRIERLNAAEASRNRSARWMR